MKTTTNKTSYLLKYVDCRIEKDDYNEGCSAEVFHSFSIPINTIFHSMESLIERMNEELFGAKYTESDFDLEQLYEYHNIQTDVMVSYKPNIDWQEFYYRTDEEMKQFEKGKQELYCASFYFIVIPIQILTNNKTN